MENHRLLRHKPTGVLYAYQDVFAIRPDFEEVTPEPAVEVKPARRRATPAEDKAAADAIAEAINADASRNLP